MQNLMLHYDALSAAPSAAAAGMFLTAAPVSRHAKEKTYLVSDYVYICICTVPGGCLV